MKLVISSFEGVGAIEFGMKISDVRMLMGKNYTTFKRNLDDELPCDYFKEKGLFVYYKLPGVVEAIEVVSPALPEIYNFSLLDASFDEAVLFLKSYDDDLELEGESCISHRMGVGVYADNSCRVDGVIVFELGYYE